MVRKIVDIQQQNIGTTLTSFDFTGLLAFSRVTIFALRADNHFVHAFHRLVPGTTLTSLAKVLLHEGFSALGPVTLPLFFDTLRIDVQRVSGTAAPFSARLIFDDADFASPRPAWVFQSRTTVGAGSNTTVLTSHPTGVFSRLAIAVTTTQAGRVRLTWEKETVNVVNVDTITLTAAGAAAASVFVSSPRFSLNLLNDNGASSNIFDISVTALP